MKYQKKFIYFRYGGAFPFLQFGICANGCCVFTPYRRWDAFYLSVYAMYTRSVCSIHIHCKRYIFLTVQEIAEDMANAVRYRRHDRNMYLLVCVRGDGKHPTQQKPVEKQNNNSSSFPIIHVQCSQCGQVWARCVRHTTQEKEFAGRNWINFGAECGSH